MAIDKHTAPPATAAEIQRAVGVTKEDRKVVDRVLAELGYTLQRESSSPAGKFIGTKVAKTAAAKASAPKPAAKRSTVTKPTSRKSTPRKTPK